MICVMPDVISKIDEYAARDLNIPTDVLMGRAGQAVFREAVSMLSDKIGRVVLLCGNGNNGGDGYCAARLLREGGVSVTVLNVFSMPPRSDSAKAYYEKFRSVGQIISLSDIDGEELASLLDSASLIIDAVLGTGARAELSEPLLQLVHAVNSSSAKVLAVDVPLGVNAGDGTLAQSCIKADRTVTLSYAKIGLYSYPAREMCGDIVNYGIGINSDGINEKFNLRDELIDDGTVRRLLPKKAKSSHKGTNGRLGVLCGSHKYRGAAALACHAALRTGAGIVNLVSEKEVCDACCVTMPELIYSVASVDEDERIMQILAPSSAIVVGCGCGVSRELYTIVCNLLSKEGCPVLLDADALNTLAEYGTDVLRTAKRSIVITPHPAEMARLCKTGAEDIQKNRLLFASEFSQKYGVVTVLKGASTVITDGSRVCIDIKGTPALAKGGSGDVLAGAISSFLSQGLSAYDAATVGVYLHSCAGAACEREYSEYGVRPSDLPTAMAKYLAQIL